MNPPTCPYCGRPAKLEDSSVVYRKSYGKIWICRRCNAWVGAKKYCNNHEPLGQLATKYNRKLRVKVHKLLDAQWEYDMSQFGTTRKKARQAAYRRLANQMGLSLRDCHIGHFNIQQCQQAIEILKGE